MVRPLIAMVVVLAAAAPAGAFTIDWDPAIGRGSVMQTTDEGRFTICLQCRYAGYTGGVNVGSQNGSGFQWVPAVAIPGYPSINLFCAQDESLWDRDAGREYDFGWSQNFGTGDDGEPLLYRGGQVIDAGPDQAVLGSTNAAGCYEVTKFLRWGAGEAFFVIATTVKNTCARDVRFDFWTGEDPWIGRYKSAEGDVGWFAGGLVEREAVIDPAEFRWGGLYDLGNEASGEKVGAFSNVADFYMPSPTGPAPDRVLFASGFAHDACEVLPSYPLDNAGMIAFNLGWTGLRLAPGKEWTVVYAMGKARTGRPHEVPTPPVIPPTAWHFAGAARAAYRPVPSTVVPAARRPPPPLAFESEQLFLHLDPDALTVEAEYRFVNRSNAPIAVPIVYPFAVDADHPFPSLVDVEGIDWAARKDAVTWRQQLGPHEARDVRVRYVQPHRTGFARYITRSTRAWGRPIDHARFVVRWPASMGEVWLSFPATRRVVGDEIEAVVEASPFFPLHDLDLRWDAPR